MTAHQQLVNDYFDHTHDDYRLLWGIDRHLGLHCGFSDARHRRHDDAVANMNRVLAKMARVRSGELVLDAGCGIGGSAIWLAENIGAHAVGVNINGRQIEHARSLVQCRGLQKLVEFHKCDYCATQLEAGSFDVVWALESVCYAEDKRAFLTEAHRLLRPGGRLIVADGFLTREALTNQERRIVERWQHGWAIPGVVSVCQFGHWLREVNFKNVRFRDVTPHVAASSRRIFAASLLFYPLGWLLARLGLRSEIRTRGIASGYYQYLARRRGLGRYGVFVADK